MYPNPSERPTPGYSGNSLTVQAARRAASLERSSPRLVKAAKRVGVDIRYLGIAPLPDQPMAYSGTQTDWIIRPADRGDAIIPADQLKRLHRLVHAGLEFPQICVAHEIPKSRLALATTTGGSPVGLDPTTAAQAIGPTAPPVETSAVAAQLGHRSQQLLDVLRTALSIAGVVTAAPFLAAGAAVAGLAAGLDPIVFGVIPATEPVPGEPAAWYVLAQWTWPDASGPGSNP